MDFDSIPRTQTGKARRVIDRAPSKFENNKSTAVDLATPVLAVLQYSSAPHCDLGPARDDFFSILGTEEQSNERSIYLRRHPHPHRPLRRHAGGVRADDLGAMPLKALMERNPQVDWASVEDIIYGCANQAGEDNRNVARMSGLLAGLPIEVPGTTVNRLCGSAWTRSAWPPVRIKSGETELMIAGGVESMSRAPFVMGKAESAFSRRPRSTTPPSAGVSSIR
jgi:hypothetical protein